MRVVGVTEFGGPEALHLLDLPRQTLGPGQVRLSVRAAGVNPTDTNYRAGAYTVYYPDEVAPWIPGMDAAGEVTEVADDVDHLSVGDEVMAVVVPHGAYREDLVISANSVVRMPHGASFVEAATLPMNGLTARRALNLMGLQAGQVLAVTGSAGAVGGFAIQLAKADGLTVIADASEADEPLVRGFGADIVVRRGDDVASRFRASFPDGVDGLMDGSLQGDLVVPAVKDGGVMTAVRTYTGDGQRGITVHTVLVSAMAEERRELDRLREQAEEGVLTLRVARTFPAERADEAHEMLERGGVRGRLVLTF